MFCSHTKHVLPYVFFHTNSPDEGPQVEMSRSFLCLFSAVEKPIVLLLYQDAATLHPGYIGLFRNYLEPF